MRLDLRLIKFKVHHIGIFTHDIVQSSKYYSKLGFNSQSDIVVDPIRNIKLQMLRNLNHDIELIEATDNRNFDSLRSAKYSIGYHLCFEVEDLDSVVENLTSGGGLIK
jgi:catechol 2,3-dioxygenase-like lactoylglutathione lyase family enzyme